VTEENRPASLLDLHEVERRLTTLLNKNQEMLMSTIAELEADVVAQTTVEASVVALLQSLTATLKDAISTGDQTAINNAVAGIEANTQALADAVVANTPSAPSTPIVTTPLPPPTPTPPVTPTTPTVSGSTANTNNFDEDNNN
jgi:hypothetical protein